MVQWIPGGIPGFPEAEGPHIFYLNTNGVEDAIMGVDDLFFGPVFTARPLQYYDPKSERDSFCRHGAVPVPDKVIETLRKYKQTFARYLELERPLKEML